jgi:putative amino acid transporter
MILNLTRYHFIELKYNKIDKTLYYRGEIHVRKSSCNFSNCYDINMSIKLNVIFSLIIAALVGGIFSGIPLGETMGILIGGMGGNSSTALSYILLGVLAAALHKTGIAEVLVKTIAKGIKGKGVILLIVLAVVSSLSQNLIPVHIAFIPILIPPLVAVMKW